MSLENFQLLDNEPIDKSVRKRDFLKVCHQQRAQLNQSDQNIDFIFGKINNYHQIGNAMLIYILISQNGKKILKTFITKILFV